MAVIRGRGCHLRPLGADRRAVRRRSPRRNRARRHPGPARVRAAARPCPAPHARAGRDGDRAGPAVRPLRGGDRGSVGSCPPRGPVRQRGGRSRPARARRAPARRARPAAGGGRGLVRRSGATRCGPRARSAGGRGARPGGGVRSSGRSCSSPATTRSRSGNGSGRPSRPPVARPRSAWRPAGGDLRDAHAEARRCLDTLRTLGRTGEVSDPAGLGLTRLLLGENAPSSSPTSSTPLSARSRRTTRRAAPACWRPSRRGSRPAGGSRTPPSGCTSTPTRWPSDWTGSATCWVLTGATRARTRPAARAQGPPDPPSGIARHHMSRVDLWFCTHGSVSRGAT